MRNTFCKLQIKKYKNINRLASNYSKKTATLLGDIITNGVTCRIYFTLGTIQWKNTGGPKGTTLQVFYQVRLHVNRVLKTLAYCLTSPYSWRLSSSAPELIKYSHCSRNSNWAKWRNLYTGIQTLPTTKKVWDLHEQNDHWRWKRIIVKGKTYELPSFVPTVSTVCR